MSRFPRAPEFAAQIATAGVTGTNGKTTTVTWLAAALGSIDPAAAQITTVGSWVGTQAFGRAEDHDRFIEILRACHAEGGRHAAIELTSAALGAGFARAWPCRVGVFTNLTLDHLELHGSSEHYLASKAQLFMSLPAGGSAVLNACDPASSLLAEVIPDGVRRHAYAVPSRGPAVMAASLVATAVQTSLDGTRVSVEPRGLPGEWPTELSLSAIGETYAENALAAWLGAVALGVPPEAAARAISGSPPPPGRFELLSREPAAVVDYAHTPDALRRVLATARSVCSGTVHLVFGVGGGPTQSKRKPLGEAAALADRITLTADNPRDEDPAALAGELLSALGDHAEVGIELDRQLAIESALEAARPEDLVLVAGKGHEAEQVVGGARRRFSDREVVLEWTRRRAL